VVRRRLGAVLGGRRLADGASSGESLEARTSTARRLLTITVVNSVLYAVWSLLLSRSSNGSAHLFATVMLFISMVYLRSPDRASQARPRP
jgi:hypothetical protein